MKVAEISIRSAHRSDICGMSDLLSQLFAIESDFTPNEEKQKLGLELLLSTPYSCVVVAEHQNAIVGMATVQTLISTAEGGRVGLVEDVVVDRDKRGKGIGSALLDYLQEWAQENRLSRLQLAADSGNHSALGFYKEVGWDRTQLVLMRWMGN
jgi:GNAT superfamily N-acetyltransferase